jgi:diguanylate cyclase (GGDEF)-like protein/PAS domain S-box-containing protein
MPSLSIARRPIGSRARPPAPTGDARHDPIRILLLEDVASDADLAMLELRRAGMACDVRCVEGEADFRQQLEQFRPAVILSDYAMPNFDGMRALELARQLQPATPFLFVSGVMGEEYAVRALKEGATDYVLKNNLLRLPAAVERALREAAEHAARLALEGQLRESERLHRDLFQGNPHPMWIFDPGTLRFLEVNDAAVARYGFSRGDFLAMTVAELHPDGQVPSPLQRAGTGSAGFDLPETWQQLTRSGEVLHVEIASDEIVMHGREARIVVAYDVTARHKAENRLRESEARFRAVVEQAVDGIFLMDPEGNFLAVNTSGSQMLGYAPGELIGLHVRLTYADAEHDMLSMRLAIGRSGKTQRYERMARRKDGSFFPVEIRSKALDNGLLQAFYQDITERRQQRERILRLQRIHAILSSINSAIVRVQTRGELFNEACSIASQHGDFHIAWIGLLEGSQLRPVAWAGEGSEFFTAMADAGIRVEVPRGSLAEKAIETRKSQFSNDITDRPNLDEIRRSAIEHGCKSAIVLPLVVAAEVIGIFILYGDQKDFFDAEEVELMEGLAADVSFALNVIAQRETVNLLAYYDPLTGLPNRSLFFDRLSQKLSAFPGERSSVALILLDIDRFRLVNDTLGRNASDELLRMIARRLREVAREQDTVARIGADEFALAFPGTWGMDEAAHWMELRGRKLFDAPFLIEGEELRLSASAGIAIAPADGTTPEALFANAEAALRNAKSRNERFMFYQPEMNVRAAETLRMETQLRQAIEKQELVLWYQPKIDLKTGRVTGFEALMRWIHPQNGIVSPAQFVPLLEQTGLIHEAGVMALTRVATDCASWVKQGVKPPRIAVNVSPMQMRQKDFMAVVIEAAAKAEEAGAALDLEITESVIMDNVEAIVPMLQTIRGLGVEIFIDDFGTGYSSLAYIARLPIHALKIDRSFVVGMMQGADSLAIVKSIISLAHALRMHVVAEGMETPEQAALLKELNCDQAQGYMISRPVAPADVPNLLRKLNGG